LNNLRVASAKNQWRGNFYLLFDYMPYDITGLIDKKIKWSLPQIKSIMKQLLMGLDYLHSDTLIAHRDIKGANILISEQGQVQITDFGLARILNPKNKAAQYTTKVITLWYRAPEVLLCYPNYNFGVDIWSMGCVFVELITGQVLFQVGTESQALDLIF
jgi:serine/threonine protein kinase